MHPDFIPNAYSYTCATITARDLHTCNYCAMPHLGYFTDTPAYQSTHKGQQTHI